MGDISCSFLCSLQPENPEKDGSHTPIYPARVMRVIRSERVLEAINIPAGYGRLQGILLVQDAKHSQLHEPILS